MNNRVRWRMGALASAIALLGSLASLDAQALGLGRISVQSALGEALRAEIEVLEISADEASSLRVGVASADAFKAAGLEYTAAVVGIQVSLQKRADGRSYLRLSSGRPIAEPFVDLILEANWASGRIVRDYTMLFDPPSLRQSGGIGAPIAPTAPIVSRSAAPAAPSAAGIGSIPYYPTSPPPVRPAPVAKAPPPAKVAAAPKAPPSGQRVKVNPGDTAGKIAAQNKPASVSLDQMLVALLRNNPDAFIGGNINRLKSGAVLDIPGADDANSASPGEASRTIVAQSKDFNDFRRKLADGVPTTQVSGANRQAGGKVQAKVEDRAPATAAPDKLTLSKGAVQGKAAAEDKIAKDRQSKDATDRVAELAKNIGDLNKLAGVPASASAAASAAKPPGLAVAKPGVLPASPTPAASAATPAVAPTAAASAVKPAVAVPAAATIAPVATAVQATQTAPVSSVAATSTGTATASVPVAIASAAASTASQPTATSKPASAPAPVVAKKAVAVPQPPPEPSLIDELTENPFVLPAFGGLLALLAGFGIYRYKRRHNPAQVDSSFLESRLQPDSFFGASGGQRIDTNEGGATGSSLVYSPSQLDAAGDVDPVAEADVYLAYGRDLQAEEILKEALRTNPTRVAVHAKLMEIYAKRRDVKGFEAIAVEAFNLTRGNGPEWAFIGEMGRDLDPTNPLYQPGGQPHLATRDDEDSMSPSAPSFGATMPQTIAFAPDVRDAPATSVDFDLDLDFSLSDEPAVPQTPPSPSVSPLAASVPDYQVEPTVAMPVPQAPAFDGLEMDFGIETMAVQSPVVAPPDLDAGLTFITEPPAAASAPVAAKVEPDSGMLEFDLGSLSLDLDGPVTESPAMAMPAVTAEDPLETKFALAEEFRALGDMDGARSLADEVLAQAKEPLKSKAQVFLNALS